MKKILLIFLLIMSFSINIVFAVSTYIDPKTGAEFNLPEIWEEVPFNEESEYLDAKFMNKDKTAFVTYSSYNVLEEDVGGEELDELRDFLDMSTLDIDYVANLFEEQGYNNVEKVTYNEVDYFKAEMKSSETFNGQQAEEVLLVHFKKGWAFCFAIPKRMYIEYYDDFKCLIESVKYPYSKQSDIKNLVSTDDKSHTQWLYDLFMQGPKAYIPYLLLSLLINLVAYGMFPLIFAFARKKVISKTKFGFFCYGINFLVNLCFIVITGKSTGAPYFLWTCVFFLEGIYILRRRRVLKGYHHLKQENSVQKNEPGEFKVVIFDEVSGKTYSELRKIDVEKVPPEKFMDNNTYYAVEKIKDGKKVIAYCKKSHWDKQVKNI